MSLPKYRNDRLELHSYCFQRHENRQEFGHTTNKAEDLVQSEVKINILRELTRARRLDFAFLCQKKSKADTVNKCKKKKKGKLKTNSCSVPGEDSSLTH